MTEQSPLLELTNVAARLDGGRAIDGLSLSISAGEIVGLVGNRGAGKRAVLDVIVGERRVDSGVIRFRRRDITDSSATDRARRGLVSPLQQTSRWERVRDAVQAPTVSAYVGRGLRTAGVRVRGRQRALLVDQMLHRVGLNDVERLTLRQLSAGTDLRVRLARLMIQQPALIVIDEPFKAWDAITRQLNEYFLVEFCRQAAVSLLVSDRSWGVLRMCDRAYVIDEHRIVDQGSPDAMAKWFDVGESRGLHSPNVRTAFISYRRDDDPMLIYNLYGALADHFGSHAIWRDIMNLRPGTDFKAQIEFAIRKCDVVLAVIGPYWLSGDRGGGVSRLFDTDDPVRMEIELAMQHRVPVVPVLVRGATMPAADQLPEVIRPLADIQALTLRDPPEFRADIDQLIAAIEFKKAERDADWMIRNAPQP